MKNYFIRKILLSFGKAMLLCSLLVFNANSTEFKIDLSEKIAREASSKIVDGVEKKKFALEIFKIRSLLDDLIASDKIINANIESTSYANGLLTIKFKLNFDKTELENFFKLIEKAPRVDPDSLIDLKSKIIKEDFKISLWINSNSNINIPPFYVMEVVNLAFQNQYRITLLSNSGEEIKATDYNIGTLASDKGKIIIVDNKEQTVSIELTSQEAAKIKSIKIKKSEYHDDTLNAHRLKYEDLIKSNQSKLILSPESSEPILAFEIAREKLLLSCKNLLTMWSKLKTNKHPYFTQVNLSRNLALFYAKLAEIIALQSLAENDKFNESYAFINDFSSIFSEKNLIAVVNGDYQLKFKSDAEIGCQKYIPKDFEYDNPAKGLGFDGGNEFNAMMNQMGMVNNSVVLGSPDQKTRVIIGFISSLTENGGIISNGKTMKDANPIQFTKNAKTVVFNPEKITVGQSLVRIVGTYDQNSKIKLTNGFGGTKIVDAANINVTCIEGMQSSDEMMRNMYKLLGIMN